MTLSPCPQPMIIGHPPMLAELVAPTGARALIVIAHPDEASRDEPGQQFVADVLRAQGFATLSFSLRTPAEDANGRPFGRGTVERRRRICSVLDWAAWSAGFSGRRVGLMGLGSAVASCVAAAAHQGAAAVGSLVLIDGRPDLAGSQLSRLQTPTLLVLGSDDARGLASHRGAARAILATHRLKVLDQPTRPCAGAGAHEAVACEAVAWLRATLIGPDPLWPSRPAEREHEAHAH